MKYLLAIGLVSIFAVSLLASWWVGPDDPDPKRTMALELVNQVVKVRETREAALKSKKLADKEAPDADAATGASSGLPPKAVIAETEYDFGTMGVGETRQHTFQIKNEGQGPLSITRTGTTCKCTLVDSPTGVIGPGEVANVRLEWTATSESETFRHGAGLETNDPARPMIKLEITGLVKNFVKPVPDSVIFSDVTPGATPESRLVIASEVWDGFEITRVESAAGLLEARSVEIEPGELAELNARSARALMIKLKPDVQQGEFAGELRLHVKLTGSEVVPPQSPVLVPVSGKVLRHYVMYGPAIVTDGSVNMGVLSQGKGSKKTFYFQFRGDPDPLPEISVSATSPAPVVSARRDDVSDGTPRFAIDVEVPADTPPVDCMGINFAKIEIETTHPKVPHAEKVVEFCVVE